ncbi:MAG: GDSL-type esterase/lipase family protein [Candidatus Hydrogenedentes bacterium]|nr:GDSL-type esterase/lipase family protein [Candidatus Hydrogenedentota bacterium]
MINIVTFAFIGGLIFFASSLLACIMITLWPCTEKRWHRSILSVCGIVAVMFIALSATPIPWIVYALWFIAFIIAWILVARGHPRARWTNISFWILSLAIAGSELRYHLPATIPTSGIDTLYVVGDSLSMGADPPHKNWPDILGSKLGMTTHTYSFGGARTDTALANAKRIEKETALVILEIGGNDLLYGAEGFDANLETILATICTGKRSVVMLELPLPPTYNTFGIAQRRLARKFGVTLIPKRYLARVLTTDGATTDGLHLSNVGHAALADALVTQFRHPD